MSAEKGGPGSVIRQDTKQEIKHTSKYLEQKTITICIDMATNKVFEELDTKVNLQLSCGFIPEGDVSFVTLPYNNKIYMCQKMYLHNPEYNQNINVNSPIKQLGKTTRAST